VFCIGVSVLYILTLFIFIFILNYIALPLRYIYTILPHIQVPVLVCTMQHLAPGDCMIG